jgi:hypothetical protein
MDKWICCGHDIAELCNRAGCSLPARCFFCGSPMSTITLEPQPEDAVAFELAELWSGVIRKEHGDPESHAPSFDQYGRPDVVAWRAVARRVFEKADMKLFPSLLDVAEKARILLNEEASPADALRIQSRRIELMASLKELARSREISIAGRMSDRDEGRLLQLLRNVAEKARAITETHPRITENDDDDGPSLNTRLRRLEVAVEALDRMTDPGGKDSAKSL